MLKESGEMGRNTSSKISRSQMELAEATGAISLTTDSLQESIARFEIQKEEDLKRVITDMVHCEIAYHVK